LLATSLCLPGVASGTIWNVSNVSQLNSAVVGAGMNDEIVIASGTYNLNMYLNLNDVGLTIRGATGNRDDVILVGGGMNTQGINEGLMVNVDNITIRDLTLKSFYYNAIHIRGENDADNALISNVRTWNIGERHVKGSGGGGPGAVSDNVIIENLYMLQTEARLDTNPSGADYIGGIDCMGVRNWTIRDCVAEGIVGATDGGNAAIFLWQGVQDVTIERNRIIGCTKGITVGLGSPNSGVFTYPYHAEDVLIRNNTVLRGPWGTGNNIGLELSCTKDVEVYNNTLYSPNSYFRLFSTQDSGGASATTNLQVINNIIRGGVFDIATGDWSAAALAAMGNIVDPSLLTVTPDWFVDPANGDFHLTELALAALNSAVALGAVPEDMDGGPRPVGAFPDMGADEYGSPAGDANYDGLVDGLDYTIWSNNFNLPGNWGEANFNGDAFVDGLDYVIWSNNYGFGYPVSPSSGAVPEPGCLLLLLVAGPLALRRKVRA